jgi:uncharacterized membrane protein YhiD involved in acid resistance
VEELLKRMSQDAGVFDLPEVLIALSLTFFLSLLVAFVYRQTHRGLSYSVSFVHTMVIMAVTVSIIMLIIGSNIARAFSLVGALSIIRFRNAVKETRDVGFLFVVMAIGMAAGTKFYTAAIVFTLFICPMIYFLHRFQIGAVTTREVIVKIQVAENIDHSRVFEPVFARFLDRQNLLSMETIRGGTLLEVAFMVVFKKGVREAEFLDQLRTVNGNQKVTILTGRENTMF